MSLEIASREGGSMTTGVTPRSSESGEVLLSVVSPFFNEADSILHFCRVLRTTLDELQIPYEVLLVNDGSGDASRSLLLGIDWPECFVIDLAENFGHQRALEAGLSLAQGEYIVTLDSDLQHPPELIELLLRAAIEDQVDVVYAIRRNSVSPSFLKRITAEAYYQVVNFMAPFPVPRNAADFRLISKRANSLLKVSTSPRAFRVLVPSLRLPSAEVEFEVAERFGGKSKYSFKHQIHLAVLSVLVAPSRWLRLFGALGILISTFGLSAMIYSVYGLVQHSGDLGLFTISLVAVSVGLQLALLAFGIEYLVHLISARSPNSRYLIAAVSRLG
jgi:polyisoprenyl-phosphate glycosyltransferase